MAAGPDSAVRLRHANREVHRAVQATALVYAGVLLGLVLVYRLELGAGRAELVWVGIEIALGAGAVALLGRGALRGSLGGAARASDVLLAVAVGAATFALSWGFVAGVATWLRVEAARWTPRPIDWLWIAVLPPLLEEALCRGVLWRALQPFSEARSRIPATAALFGLLHCTGGPLGFPHRFVTGLAFGWLRQRSGSLVPPIVAHATHNALALLVAMAGG